MATSSFNAVERRCSLSLLVAVYLSLSGWMFSQERGMRRSGGPGIVGFELAGSVDRVEEIPGGPTAGQPPDVRY